MRRTAEFEAFGPWIDEVHEPEDVPRLYRGQRLDLGSARLALKVPRRISRRDATPDMDLYDHLVVAGAEELTLLSRQGSGCTVQSIPYRRIAVLQSSVDLLDGRFRVQGTTTSSAALSFGYNSVSHELVERLVRVLREEARALETAPPAARTPHPPLQLGLRDLGDDDVALVTEQRDLSEHERSFVPLATHPRTRVRRRDGALRGLLDAVRPVTLQAAVVCAGPGELHLVHRRRWFTTGRAPVTSVAHTVVLTPRVTATTVRKAVPYQDVRVVRITSGESRLEVPFPVEAASGAAIEGVLRVGVG
jgi:hypothetical protein